MPLPVQATAFVPVKIFQSGSLAEVLHARDVVRHDKKSGRRKVHHNPMLLGGEATPLKTALLPPEASW